VGFLKVKQINHLDLPNTDKETKDIFKLSGNNCADRILALVRERKFDKYSLY